jgi:hypothetical protein
MVQSRVWCAVAVLCLAACSFPEFRVPAETGTSCADGLQNGQETGVDCGGPSCAACPTCDDELRNGDESDVDCGGACSSRCEMNQRCREGADCASRVCNEQFVCEPPSCQDRVRNGSETGVDCGGACEGCGNGSACQGNDDCTDRRCQEGVCVSAGCTDGLVNGHESDLDCGGSECAPCKPGGKCDRAEDCDSGICNAAGTCVTASCNDLAQNQGESDVDCGGPSCSPCEIGGTCELGTDCDSGLCRSHTCVPETPSGQPLSSASWKLSSSEAQTQSGTSSAFDGVDGTAWSSGKPQYSGMYVDLDLGAPRIFFKALLKVTAAPYGEDFPGRIDVYVSSDGNFGEPTLVGQQGNQWLWCDFQTAQVARYLRFQITEPKSVSWSIGELQILN